MAFASSIEIGSYDAPAAMARRAAETKVRDRLHRIAVIILSVVIVAGAGVLGVWARHRLWNATQPQRFGFDISNAYHWGSRVMNAASADAVADGKSVDHATDWKYFLRGYVGLYDQVVGEADDENFYLDYSPARLLVVSLWVRHERLVYPHVRTWMPGYHYSAPLLRFNTACEAIAAILSYLIVWHWMRRDRMSGSAAHFCALVAALLVWFEPALIVDAHIWPQWDAWLLPFYLGAILAASHNRWFMTGALLAFGAMFKGQLSIISLFLALWPLFERKPMASLRLLVGGALTLAVITSPWIINGKIAWTVALALPVIAAISLALWSGGWMRRNGPLVVAIIAMVAFYGVSFAFHGSYAWKDVSFGYPTRHFKQLAMGDLANLAAILAERPFGWRFPDVAFHLPRIASVAPIAVPMKILLEIFYGAGLVLCAWAAARQSRRNSRRFLVVVAAPFVLMFVLLPMMHERYLIWGAVTSGLAVGIELDLALVHLLISAIAFLMVYQPVMGHGNPASEWLRRLFQAAHPGDAWVMLIVAGFYLYQIWRTPRKVARYAQ